MNKVHKLIECVRSNCLACFPFLKSQRESHQQNYAPLSNENRNTSSQIISKSAQIIETSSYPPIKSPTDKENQIENSQISQIIHKKFGDESYFVEESQAIIDDLSSKINENFEGWEKLCDYTEKPHKLKMYLKSYIKENKNRVSIMRLEYIASCTAEQFIKFQNDVDESRNMLAKNLDFLEAFKQFGPENCYKLMYSRYKKILTASPRDFVYIKHYRKINKEGENCWLEYSKSIEHENHPECPEKVRGTIVLSGQIAQDLGNGKCFVKNYIEVDFRFSLPLLVTKPASLIEMRSYVERCEERFKQLFKVEAKGNEQLIENSTSA